MRKILVAGNWKMHGSKAMVAEWVAGVLEGAGDTAVDMALFPPSPYLSQVAEPRQYFTTKIHNQGLFVAHGRDGKIRAGNSYGNDPYPPKDTK